MQRLAGKSALVIGSATGIGRAVAIAFAREGAVVTIADRGHEDERRELIAEIVGAGGTGSQVECDVTEEWQVEAAVMASIKAHGKLDILVNNAGVGGRSADFCDLPDADWAELLEINLRGVGHGMRHALPHMLERRSGRIINTASQLAHKPAPGNAMYSASKAAVVALTTAVAFEVAMHGVAVNCVCPGPTDTPLWRSGDPKWRSWKAAQLPIGRIAEPEEIAGAYVYLASDEASFMIGQSISPNGGDIAW